MRSISVCSIRRGSVGPHNSVSFSPGFVSASSLVCVHREWEEEEEEGRREDQKERKMILC